MDSPVPAPRSNPNGAPVKPPDQPGGEQTAFALPDEVAWSELGATRVTPTDAVASSSRDTEVRGADTAVRLQAGVRDLAEGLEYGEFRLLKKIGEGAMGEVWRAFQSSFNRDVALKILFPHVASNPKLVQRLRREGQAMFELDHPNIVQSYGLYEVLGRDCIAMEFVDGDSLQKWLARLGTLSVADSLHIVLTCARALEYAHARQLVHRDVKPDNLLIRRDGRIKLGDLGMVKSLDDDELALTQTGHAVGTPWYMPLEQARNAKETDGRCDIYALGCMLYCLLTGKPPFSGRTIVEVIEAKEKGTFPPVRRSNSNVPERLDLIICKMTAKQPAHRYQTCTELIRDLVSLELAGEQLEFLGGVPKAAPRRAARLQSEESRSSAAATVQAPISLPSADQAKKEDVWYVRYRDPQGKIQIRKMTRTQVLALGSLPNFDPTAEASRQPDEGFRALGTYGEFQHLVLARLSKAGADQQAVRYRNLYKKIEAQEKKREEVKENDEGALTWPYWLGVFAKLAGIFGAIALALFLTWYYGTNLFK